MTMFVLLGYIKKRSFFIVYQNQLSCVDSKMSVIHVTVLRLPLRAHLGTPVLCVRCDHKEHCLMQAAFNFAKYETDDIQPTMKMTELSFELHPEVIEALHMEREPCWHVGNGYGFITEAGGVRAVGIASTIRERKRVTMLAFAVAVRVLRNKPHLEDIIFYGQDFCEKLRCLVDEVSILMRRDGEPAAAAPALASTAAAIYAANTAPPHEGVFPWAPRGAGLGHWGPRIPSPGGPPPNRLVPPPPPRPAAAAAAQVIQAETDQEETHYDV
jgi:hypothetical protein